MSIPRLNVGFLRGTNDPFEQGLVLSSPYLSANRMNLQVSEGGQAEVLGAVFFTASTPDKDFDTSTCQGGNSLALFNDSKWKTVFGLARPTKFGFVIGNADFAQPIEIDIRVNGRVPSTVFVVGSWLDIASGDAGVITTIGNGINPGVQAFTTGLTTGTGRLLLHLELINYTEGYDVSV